MSPLAPFLLAAAALGGTLLSVLALWRELAFGWSFRRQASLLAALFGLTCPLLHAANAGVFLAAFVWLSAPGSLTPASLSALVESILAVYAGLWQKLGWRGVSLHGGTRIDAALLEAVSLAAASMALAWILSALSSLPAAVTSARRTRQVLDRLEASFSETTEPGANAKPASRKRIRYF